MCFWKAENLYQTLKMTLIKVHIYYYIHSKIKWQSTLPLVGTLY